MTLLAWFVLQATDSPWLVALVGFFGMAPLLALGPLGGVLADTMDRQSVIRVTQTTNLLSAILMSIALFANIDQFWYAYPVIAIVGVGWALDMPSRRSAIHDLLGRTGVTNGFALDSVGMSASSMLGPALGGGLIAMISVTGGFASVVGLYLASLVLVWQVQLPSSTGEGSKMSIVRDLKDSVRYVVRNQALLATVMVTVVMNLLLFPYQNMIPVIARDVLDAGPGLMGLLQALPGLGALVGGGVVASLTSIRYHGRFYTGGSLVALSGLLAFSFSQWYGVSAIILVYLGMGTAGFGSMQATLVALLAKEDMRGKILGIISLAIGAGPLGALLVGGMADLWHPMLALRIEAISGLVCIGLIALLLPALGHRISTDGCMFLVPSTIASSKKIPNDLPRTSGIPMDSD